MKPLSIQEIRQAVGGKALSPFPQTAPLITSVSTDTRRMEPGCLFVALRGDKFDAHNFLPDAAKAGAIAALVEERPKDRLPNVHLVGVTNTRAALGKLATFVRQQMRSKVIAVAGSNGKTSTKHLVDAALGLRFKGSISPKSYNNDIGVPLAIFPADPMQDYIVLEMGTNHPGEINVLTEMAQPDIAVVTNCGAEHLEFLGDLMGVRRENATIINGLSPGGALIINGDDPQLREAVSAYPGKIITFGFNEKGNDLFAHDVRCDEEGTKFVLNNSRTEIFVPMLGRHTACNALAAIAVARRLGVSEEMIVDGLSHCQGPEMRLQPYHLASDMTMINDAYNANPNSMRAALETIAALKVDPPGRRIAVLGDMRELGASSERYHRELGEFAATCGLDVLACVGEGGEVIAHAAEQAKMPLGAVCRFKDADAAANEVPTWLRAGDLVLLKASRSVRLERVAEAITKRGQHAGKSLRRVG
jgi:UDP-N-acetylmuramoyl-tripeptide--D-alanyl-D-alanine ligase